MDESSSLNPYANMAQAQKEKVQAHILRRQKAFATRVDSQRLSLTASMLLRRQSFYLGSSFLELLREKENMFEHFIVAGYPPHIQPTHEQFSTHTPAQPQILFQYPASALSNPQVASFCFPDGIVPSPLDESQSQGDLHSFMFGSLTTLEDAEHSYLFLLNGGEAVLYGICVVQNELLNQAPSFFVDTTVGGPEENRTQATFSKRLSKSQYISAPRCYCLISRFPFFKLHFDVLYNLIATERMKIFSTPSPKSLPACPAMNVDETDKQDIAENENMLHENVYTPSNNKCATKGDEDTTQLSNKLRELKKRRKELKKKVLNEEKKDASSKPAESRTTVVSGTPVTEERPGAKGKLGASGKLIEYEQTRREKQRKGKIPYKMDNEVMKLLRSYRKTKVSVKELTFQMPPDLRHYHFTVPESNADKLLTNWCLVGLFRFFFLSDIVTIFQYCLLEKKILFISKNLGILSTVVMSLIPLLKPFVWQGPFIPVLPKSLEECVQSPVPFIIGSTGITSETREIIADECLIIDIESYTWTYPKILPPELPNRASLISSLEKYYFVIHPGSIPTTTPQSPAVSPSISPRRDAITPSSPKASPVKPKEDSEPTPTPPSPSKGSSWRNLFTIKKNKPKEDTPKPTIRYGSGGISPTKPLTERARPMEKSRSVSSITNDRVTISRSDPGALNKRASWFNVKSNDIIKAVESEAADEGTPTDTRRRAATDAKNKTPIQLPPKPSKPSVPPIHLMFPTKMDELEMMAIEGIMKELTEYQRVFVNQIITYSEWNTDWSSRAAVEDIVRKFPRSEQEFMHLFFDTQTFAVYTEHLVDIAFKAKISQNRKLIEQVEEKIIQEETQKAAAFSVLQIYSSSSGVKSKKKLRGQEEAQQELEETISCVDLRISALEQAKQMLKQESKQMLEEKRTFENKRRLAQL